MNGEVKTKGAREGEAVEKRTCRFALGSPGATMPGATESGTETELVAPGAMGAGNAKPGAWAGFDIPKLLLFSCKAKFCTGLPAPLVKSMSRANDPAPVLRSAALTAIPFAAPVTGTATFGTTRPEEAGAGGGLVAGCSSAARLGVKDGGGTGCFPVLPSFSTAIAFLYLLRLASGNICETLSWQLWLISSSSPTSVTPTSSPHK